MCIRSGRREEGSFIFRYIELELFGLFACHFIHEQPPHPREREMKIADTCFQVRCKRNQTGTESVSS